MKQTCQGVRSTKRKATPSTPTWEVSPISSDIPSTKSNELFVVVKTVSKLYIDDMGWFTILSRYSHHYIMLAFHCDINAILIEPFQYRYDHHHIAAHSRIMTCLSERGYAVDLQVLNNQASKEYHQVVTQTWKAIFQLVPPNVHRRNAAECAIRTFKAHFLVILAGMDSDFPSSLWDTLLPHIERTLNLIL